MLEQEAAVGPSSDGEAVFGSIPLKSGNSRHHDYIWAILADVKVRFLRAETHYPPPQESIELSFETERHIISVQSSKPLLSTLRLWLFSFFPSRVC